MAKFCGRCKRDLDFSCFAKNRSKKDGLQERCIECRAAHHQATKHNRKPQTKEQKRKYLINSYGINEELYKEMLECQNNTCAICNSSDWGKPSPSIDHCHTTGKVRGLLCNNCNRGLGLFRDSLNNLKNAVEYVKKSRSG